MVRALKKTSMKDVQRRVEEVNNPIGTNIVHYWIQRKDFIKVFFKSGSKESLAFIEFVTALLVENGRTIKELRDQKTPGGEASASKPKPRKSSISKRKKLRWKKRREMHMYMELEKDITRRLAQELQGSVEVTLPFGGRADIVSSEYIVEVKRLSLWRFAIGQIVAYGVHFPDKKKRIHLFGNKDLIDSMVLEREDIERVCGEYGIMVTYEVCSAVALV